MNIREGVRQSFEVIAGNKVRSLLTMLGINFGVGCLIAISVVGLAFRNSISGEMGRYGSTLVWVQNNWEAYASGERRTNLDGRDIRYFESNLPGLEYSGTMYSRQSAVRYQGNSQTTQVYGVDPDHFVIFAVNIASGRALSADDAAQRRRVAVLRPDIASTLFPHEEPIGKSIRVEDGVFTVVGVTERLENPLLNDGSDNDSVFVPSGYVSRRIFGGGPPEYWVYFLRFGNSEQVESATHRMESYLTNRYGELRGEPRFRIERSDQYIGMVNRVLDIVGTLVGVIAAISLVVGGLGIMNIMLVTVSERTREIGVRMAIGAQPRDILSQFLIEAVTLCLIGGGIGALFGAGLAAVVCTILEWRFGISLGTVLLALSVSTGIGLLFGTYPAYKASRLTPIEALRADQ